MWCVLMVLVCMGRVVGLLKCRFRLCLWVRGVSFLYRLLSRLMVLMVVRLWCLRLFCRWVRLVILLSRWCSELMLWLSMCRKLLCIVLGVWFDVRFVVVVVMVLRLLCRLWVVCC